MTRKWGYWAGRGSSIGVVDSLASLGLGLDYLCRGGERIMSGERGKGGQGTAVGNGLVCCGKRQV